MLKIIFQGSFCEVTGCSWPTIKYRKDVNAWTRPEHLTLWFLPRWSFQSRASLSQRRHIVIKRQKQGILPGNWSQLSKCIHYARFSHIYSDSSFILCTPVPCDASACFDGAYSLGLSESGVTVWHVFFFHFLFRTSAVDVRRWLKCEKERCSERQKKLCRASTVAHQEHPRGGSMELASVSVLQRSCWVGVTVGWWETANESPIPIVFSSFCSVSQRVSALYREASYNSMLSWRRPCPRHWYAFQQSLAAMEQMYTCALSL